MIFTQFVIDIFFSSQNGVEHAHAFIYSPEACRFCDVDQNLNGKHNHSSVVWMW